MVTERIPRPPRAVNIRSAEGYLRRLPGLRVPVPPKLSETDIGAFLDRAASAEDRR